MTCAILLAASFDCGTRNHVVSIPAKSPSVMGDPSKGLKYSLRAPRRGGLPTPWLLCMLTLAAAISVYAFPSSGLTPPASIVVRPAGSNGMLRLEKKKADVFQTR